MLKDDALSDRIASNIRTLRDGRGLTQQQMAKLSGLPRATWANLESGAANPTLTVLHKVAQALQVSLEELIATQRAACEFHAAASLPLRRRGAATVRSLLPDRIPATEIDRIELPKGAHLVGVPHTPGTREYLTCEVGELQLTAAGEQWTLKPGDVVIFRGDQRHSYKNLAPVTSVGYSVVLVARAV